MKTRTLKLFLFVLGLAAIYAGLTMADPPPAGAPESTAIPIPTGKAITPTAARGATYLDLNPEEPSAPELRGNQASAVAISPDGRTLAILTSGFTAYYGPDSKIAPKLSTERIFVFDVTGAEPKQTQVLPLAHAFQGLAWAPSSDRLFVSGGKDDMVVEFIRAGSGLAAGRSFSLGHKA